MWKGKRGPYINVHLLRLALKRIPRINVVTGTLNANVYVDATGVRSSRWKCLKWHQSNSILTSGFQSRQTRTFIVCIRGSSRCSLWGRCRPSKPIDTLSQDIDPKLIVVYSRCTKRDPGIRRRINGLSDSVRTKYCILWPSNMRRNRHINATLPPTGYLVKAQQMFTGIIAREHVFPHGLLLQTQTLTSIYSDGWSPRNRP